MKNEIQSVDSVENVIALLRSGAQHLADGAAMLARVVAKDPEAIHKIAEQAPQIPASFLNRLLKVGEGALHVDLLLNGCPAYQRLALLPYSAQESALRTKNVPMVVNAETGEALKVSLVELTPEQVKQVIGPTGLRAKDEQQAYIRRKSVVTSNAAVTEKIVGPAYVIKRGRIVILRQCEISTMELLQLLQQMQAV